MKRYVVGVDTSAYTTSVACVDIQSHKIIFDGRIVLTVPKGTCGLRQSEALFQHVKNLPVLFQQLFELIPGDEVQMISVSTSPVREEDSYMPVFLAGKSGATSAAAALGVPLHCVSHQEGHIRAALYGHEQLMDAASPLLMFHFSGGTSDFLSVDLSERGRARAERIGYSDDLHAGQFVDRIGVALGLHFPAGKELEALARQASVKNVKAPAAVKGCSCSFAGPESGLQRAICEGIPAPEVAYGVYDCLARSIEKILRNYMRETGKAGNVLLCGGVSSSGLLRELLNKKMMKTPFCISFSEPVLSSDNAVGAALLGADLCEVEP